VRLTREQLAAERRAHVRRREAKRVQPERADRPQRMREIAVGKNRRRLRDPYSEYLPPDSVA
jgi:hypothetical protein